MPSFPQVATRSHRPALQCCGGQDAPLDFLLLHLSSVHCRKHQGQAKQPSVWVGTNQSRKLWGWCLLWHLKYHSLCIKCVKREDISSL
jgi:hypothetical protein